MPPSNNRSHRKYIHDNKSNDKELSLKINKYYSSTSWDYRLVWSHRHLHFGYWDSDTRSHRESLINMNRHVARKAGLSANTHILDAGCGVGGLSTWLAKEYDTTVSGITICQSQLVQARQFAIAKWHLNRSRFGIRIDHDLASISDRGLASQSITIWHASDH